MFSISKSIKATLFLLFATVFISQTHSARTRLRNTLDVKFNFKCDEKECNFATDQPGSAVNLFQVASSNPESPDKTNYILSTIGGPPMVIATGSSQESNLIINWETLLRDPGREPDELNHTGLYFDSAQDASIGLLLQEIILYDDTNGNSEFDPTEEHHAADMSELNWDLASKSAYTKDDFLKLNFRTKKAIPNISSNFTVKLSIPRDFKADRQKEIPHLKLNNQSISMVIAADGMQIPTSWTRGRLHVAFVVVFQSPKTKVKMNKSKESLISDEYSPGAFRIRSLQLVTDGKSSNMENKPSFDDDAKAPELDKPVNIGFFFWKEVAYTDRRKIISKTIDVIDTETDILSWEKDRLKNLTIKSAPFYQYFQQRPMKEPNSDYKIFILKLNFGREDSNFEKFVDFSFVFGLGTAPQEQMFSFLVKIIIFICFCLPIVVMVAGLAYLMLKRFSQNSDTELLLAAET